MGSREADVSHPHLTSRAFPGPLHQPRPQGKVAKHSPGLCSRLTRTHRELPAFTSFRRGLVQPLWFGMKRLLFEAKGKRRQSLCQTLSQFDCPTITMSSITLWSTLPYTSPWRLLTLSQQDQCLIRQLSEIFKILVSSPLIFRKGKISLSSSPQYKGMKSHVQGHTTSVVWRFEPVTANSVAHLLSLHLAAGFWRRQMFPSPPSLCPCRTGQRYFKIYSFLKQIFPSPSRYQARIGTSKITIHRHSCKNKWKIRTGWLFGSRWCCENRCQGVRTCEEGTSKLQSER